MALFEQLQLLQRLDALITQKRTGSAKDLGAKLGICRSSVFNYFDTLRQFGVEIEYCEFRKSYFYVDDKRPRLPMNDK